MRQGKIRYGFQCASWKKEIDIGAVHFSTVLELKKANPLQFGFEYITKI